VAIAVIAFLGGCGGSNASSSTQASAPPASTAPPTSSTTATSEPPHQINRKQSHAQLPGSPAAFVRAALTTSHPKLACAAYTNAALKHAYGGEPGCEQAIRSGGVADAVRVMGVYAGKEAARVLAVPSGGPSDGEKLRISLVLQGKTWRIASIHANVPVGP